MKHKLKEADIKALAEHFAMDNIFNQNVTEATEKIIRKYCEEYDKIMDILIEINNED